MNRVCVNHEKTFAQNVKFLADILECPTCSESLNHLHKNFHRNTLENFGQIIIKKKHTLSIKITYFFGNKKDPRQIFSNKYQFFFEISVQ